MFKRLSHYLDVIYKLGAWVSGGLLVLLCGLILYSVVARFLGLYSGGASDVSGYVMATSTFLALAYTFRTQGHIRVALLIQRFKGEARRRVEVLCLGVMFLVSSFVAFYMLMLVLDSYEYGERSEGADALLLWIPQTPVAVGAILLAIAVAHTFLQAIFEYDAVNPEVSTQNGVNEV